MKIIKIKDNTFCIDTGASYIPFYKINSEDIIMLDTGLKQEGKGIDRILEKNNLKVAGIICSHIHPDHIGNNQYFKQKYNSTIAMPAFEALICSSLTNLMAYYSGHTLASAKKYLQHMVCKTDVMISDNESKVIICGVEFEIIHNYGHSPEHICIVTPDDVAYLADALISYDVMERLKIPYSYVLIEDFKSKNRLNDFKNSKYILAHKGIYDDIAKLINDNISFYKNRAESIYTLIIEPMTMEEIIKAVTEEFNININDFFRYIIIQRMIKSHIEYLNEIGRLELNFHDGFLKYTKCI